MTFLYAILILHVMYSIYVQYKLIFSKLILKKQKVYQSIVIWTIPFIGAFLVNWLLKYKSPEGSHKNKIPSWKRLVKYEDNGWG